MTFREYVKIFIKERASELAPVTIVNYERELSKAAILLGEKQMDEISFLDMKRYILILQSSDPCIHHKHQLKYGTLVQHYVILHTFFENACENEVISVNPMEKLKRPRPKKSDVMNEPIFFNEDEVKNILSCVNNEKLMWKTLIYFMIDSGCRCGEAMALKWEAVDFSNGCVKICRNLQYTSGTGVYLCSPKSGKKREIYLNNQVLELLKEWKSVQESNTLIKGINYNGFCFTKRNGNLMMPSCINSYLRRFGKKYNIRGIHPHALRHTMASLSITNGADIVSVSKKLGHSKVAITLNVYSHATEEAQKRANEVLAKAIYT